MKRSTTHFALATLLAMVLAVVLAGCGGSSQDDTAATHPATGSATPVTVAGFKAQANALCRTADADLKTLASALPSASAAAQGDAAAEKIADRIDTLVAAITALPAPNELRAGVVHLLDTVSAVSSRIHAQKLAFFKTAATTKIDPFAGADTESRALGLDACAGD